MQDFKDAHEYLMSKIKIKQKKKMKTEQKLLSLRYALNFDAESVTLYEVGVFSRD